MKRIATWLFVISFTFAFGVSATLLYVRSFTSIVQELGNAKKEDTSTELPAVTYCKLVSDPEKYNGKIVRLTARLTSGKHGLLFMDADCSDVEQAAVIFNPQNREEIKRNYLEVGKSGTFSEDLDLITVGRFRKVIPSFASDALVNTASLQFEIMHIEKGSKLR